MKKWERAWLASAVDGEGCITNNIKNGNNFQIYVVNTNINYLKRAQELTDGRIYIMNRKNMGNRVTCYKLSVFKRAQVLKTLKEILPFLIIKKEKALKAIAILKTLPKSRREYYKQKIAENPKLAMQMARPLLEYRKTLTQEQKSELAKKAWASRDPEEIKRTQKMNALKAVQKYPTSKRQKKMKKYWSRFSPEERSAMVRQWHSKSRH